MTQQEVEEALSYIRERKRSYQQGCGSETTAVMMDDLAEFCRAETSCFHADPRIHAVLEGRREVWIRIQNHLTKTPEQLLEINIATLKELKGAKHG